MECLSACACDTLFVTGLRTALGYEGERGGRVGRGATARTAAVFFAPSALVLGLAEPRNKFFSEGLKVHLLGENVEDGSFADVNVGVAEACRELGARVPGWALAIWHSFQWVRDGSLGEQAHAKLKFLVVPIDIVRRVDVQQRSRTVVKNDR